MHLRLLKPVIFLLICSFIITLNVKNDDQPKSKVEKQAKTPSQLKAETISFKTERRKKGWSKPDKPSEYIKYHNRIRTKPGQTKPDYKPNYKLTEQKKALNKRVQLKSASEILNWVEHGPGNVSGRTRGLIIDPDDTTGNTWFTGSVGGGIWKTSDAGQHWQNLTPNLPTLSTVCLAISLSNTNVIYAGTGEGFFNGDAIIGDGIFKSTDKGDTWNQIESTASNEDFTYINRIIVHPQNEDILIAATNTSIQKSTDGGISWNTVYAKDTRIQQILADPNNFNILYATSYFEGVLKSSDQGETWNIVHAENSGRIEMAIAPSITSTVYALAENSQLYLSENSGISWAPAKITSGSQDAFLNTQGWYNNALAVSPDDPKLLFIGGVNVYKVEVTGKDTESSSFVTVSTEGTDVFMEYINHGGDYLLGGMEVIAENTNYSNIEVQYGEGKSQLAHRFFVPEGETSGVPSSSHEYQDYVMVPFEVWDISNNKQLMVSFRDQDRSGDWNLTAFNDELLIGREYVWINNIEYNTTPSSEITVNGGHEYNEIAFWWPILAEGYEWDSENLPESKIIILRNDVFASKLRSTKVADWAGLGAPYVHADLHNIQFTKNTASKNRIIVCNDGGVGYSDDMGNTWKNPTNGYNTTQFYGVDKHPTKLRFIGGLQDNGSWVSPENPDHLSQWTETTGGDGFDAVWHATDPTKLISTVYNNSLYLSRDGGETWGNIGGFQDEGSSNAPFITQIGYSPISPNKLYITGVSGITYSEDFGQSWTLTEIPEDTWGWNGDSYVEPSNANPEVVWAAARMSSSGSVHVSEDGGKSFRACNNYLLEKGILSGLATHPLDENSAFAIFSLADEAKILRTTDLGETWEDITGFDSTQSNNGFPNVATYCLQVMPHNPNEIWAGTEIGLFISKNNGESWEYANNGLPSVSIWELKVRGDYVLVATHGRGIWSVQIPEINTAVKAPTLISVTTTPKNQTGIEYIFSTSYDSVSLVIDNTPVKTIITPVTSDEKKQMTLNLELEEGVHNLKILAYKNGFNLKSTTQTFLSIRYNEAQKTYKNSFDTESDDFVGNGFELTTMGALGSGMAIHSEHPYESAVDYFYYLKTPIIVDVSESKHGTTLQYKDIPFIEEGEQNAEFGSANFYDYIVVEGSTDGTNWQALADGYDFTKVKAKAFALGKSIDDRPSKALFLNHNVDISQTFAKNDTIIIRFRLFSDANTTGWGWIGDDINIAEAPITYVDETLNGTNEVYPIPCHSTLTIELDEKFKNSTIYIYHLNGKIVFTEENTNENRLEIPTYNLLSGNYILEIKSGDKVDRRKISILH